MDRKPLSARRQPALRHVEEDRVVGREQRQRDHLARMVGDHVAAAVVDQVLARLGVDDLAGVLHPLHAHVQRPHVEEAAARVGCLGLHAQAALVAAPRAHCLEGTGGPPAGRRAAIRCGSQTASIVGLSRDCSQ